MLKITSLKTHHLDKVIAILQPILKDKRLKQSLKMHLKLGVAQIGIDDITDEIEAIGCFVVGKTQSCSLSYYWIAPKYRGKMESLFFYAHIFSLIPDGYPVYIHAKNIESFKNYVSPTALKDEYLWCGLRSLNSMKEKVNAWAAQQK
jgi:hypothetical protein